MKVIVCGGREYDNYFVLSNVLLQVYKDYCFTTIVQGGARGADMLARKWAIENNFPYEEYAADWARYPGSAGFIRNQEMLDESGATLVVAFPGGNGTWDMMKRAKAKPGVELIVVNEGGKETQLTLDLKQPEGQLRLNYDMDRQST